MQTRYLIQAGMGQAELWSLSRDIDEVIADPETDERTRVLLKETRVIMGFAKEHGFSSKGNYEQFVELDRSQVVWFLAAAKPLKLEPEIWTFPLVGSFPYLGWFDRREAVQIRERLKGRGLDTYMRPVHAYSTGGWLDDPILSTMLSSEDDAFRYLSNILLHELTHANLFVEDQATFNESIASFVGDTMAGEYLAWRFGEDSEELRLYREEAAESEVRGARFVQAHTALEVLYASDKSDAEKLAGKERITSDLQHELHLSWKPNNASLVGFKVYNTGQEEFAALYEACSRKWAPFFASIQSLKASDFGKEQLEEIDTVIKGLQVKCRNM
jgi:predicted aminopeptidase